MKRLLVTGLLALGWLGFGACPGWAQKAGEPPYGSGTSTVSPYLNLVRSGNRAVNYYGIVRPQQRFNEDISRLQQGVAANQAAIISQDPGLSFATGHPSAFLNHQRFFLTSGGAAGSAAGRERRQQTPGISAVVPGAGFGSGALAGGSSTTAGQQGSSRSGGSRGQRSN